MGDVSTSSSVSTQSVTTVSSESSSHQPVILTSALFPTVTWSTFPRLASTLSPSKPRTASSTVTASSPRSASTISSLSPKASASGGFPSRTTSASVMSLTPSSTTSAISSNQLSQSSTSIRSSRPSVTVTSPSKLHSGSSLFTDFKTSPKFAANASAIKSSSSESACSHIVNKSHQTVQGLCNKLTSDKWSAQALSSMSHPLSIPSSSKSAYSKLKAKRTLQTDGASRFDDFGFASLLPNTVSKQKVYDFEEPLNLVTKDSVKCETPGFKTSELQSLKVSPSCTSENYKSTHPIGSRKVTENVITYHEPMFQSVANSIFENQKNLTMGKRKADEDKSKGESGSPDYKKLKLTSAGSSGNMAEVNRGNKRKKCSIENIIERIRTEKTVSRGDCNTNASPTPKTSQEEMASETKETKMSDIVQYSKSVPANDVQVVSDTPKSNEQINENKSEILAKDSEHPSNTSDTLTHKSDTLTHKSDTLTHKSDTSKTETVEKETSEVKSLSKEIKTDMECSTVQTKIEVDRSPNSKKIPTNKDCDKSVEVKEETTEEQDVVRPCDTSDSVENHVKENLTPSESIQSATEDIAVKSPVEKKLKTVTNGSTDSKNANKTAIDPEKKITVKKKTKPTVEDFKVPPKDVKDSVKKKSQTKKKTKGIEPKTMEKSTLEKGKIKPKLHVKKQLKEKTDTKGLKTKKVVKDIVDKPKKKTVKKIQETPEDNISTPIKKSKTTDGKSAKKTKANTKPKVKDNKEKIKRPRKNKLPIACRRVKREASLNASAFVNIMCETGRSPKSPKLNTKRSKSESDIKITPTKHMLSSSVSVTDVGFIEKLDISKVDESKFTKLCGIDKDKSNSTKSHVGFSPKISKGIFAVPKSNKEKMTKTPSPRRKVSFSDDSFDSVFEAVIQKSIEETNNKSAKKETGKKEKKKITGNMDKLKKQISNKKDKVTKDNEKNSSSKTNFKSDKKDKKFRLQKIKKAIQLTVSKSPEEMAEKKRKASLARLERAKEILKTKKRVSDEFPSDDNKESTSDSESVSSSDSVVETDSVEVETEINTDKEVDAIDDGSQKIKLKKGALCRAARTHVSVESKTVVENAMPSPRWCECCQSTYYPSQPTQGAQVWRIKQLVDKGSSKSPEPIQTSSHHFIAAHASCEVRPYASPSHVSVLESNPYVGQIVPHGHIQCSACSCGHSGMFHATSCQNCTLGGVMSCQRYGNTYSVSYPHSHGSYTHCGCGSCYPAGTYHHTVGQTLIHQPQMSMTADSPILLHHPVQLQVTHETTHPVSMPTLSHSHSEPGNLQHSVPIHSESSSLSHSVAGVAVSGLQLSQGDQNQLSRMCQLSQGELTNVSVLASSLLSDQEIVDVGSRDDIIKQVPNVTQTLESSEPSSKNTSSAGSKSNSSLGNIIKRKKSKSSESSDKEKKKFKKADKQKRKDKPLKTVSDKKKLKLQLLKKREKHLNKKDKSVKQNSLDKCEKKKTNDSLSLKQSVAKSLKSKVEAVNDTQGKKLKASARKERKKSKDEKDKVPNIVKLAEIKEQKRAWHGWSWDGEGTVKKLTNIFDGQPVLRKCYNGIVHEDGEKIQVKDCVLVCSGRKEKDIPYVAKVTNFWDDDASGEMMMSVLWFYRPEHAEGGRRHEHLDNEVFAAKHRDETLVACIEDRGYVLTFNEYCRFIADVERVKSNLPPRKNVVPEPEDSYPSNRIPPVDVDPDNVFLCRQVYDIKLKRVLKNPS